MPLSKQKAKRNYLADLHARVSHAKGFRPRDLKPGEAPCDVARGLKALETRGLVMFVPGVGWVDSEPAIRRYRENTGLAALTGNGLAVGTDHDATGEFGSYRNRS